MVAGELMRRCTSRGAGVAQHADDLAAGGAAHDRVVDDDDALALQDFALGVEFYFNAEIANRLLRLDERAADIMIADQAELEGNLRFFGDSPSPPARRSPAPA